MTISLNSRYEAAMDFKIIGYVGETNSRGMRPTALTAIK